MTMSEVFLWFLFEWSICESEMDGVKHGLRGGGGNKYIGLPTRKSIRLDSGWRRLLLEFIWWNVLELQWKPIEY